MIKRSKSAVLGAVCLAVLGAAAPAAIAATAAPVASPLKVVEASQAELVANDKDTWYFSGTVRYVCGRTGKEKAMGFSGLTPEMTLDQAMAFARESGAAQGSQWGRVVSVHVETIF